MTVPRRALLAAAAAAALTGGCDTKPAERQQAAGEVLEGTISDAMIETDQIRSAAPIAPRRAEGEAGGPADKVAPRAKADEASPAPAEPTATPTPETTSTPAAVPAAE